MNWTPADLLLEASEGYPTVCQAELSVIPAGSLAGSPAANLLEIFPTSRALPMPEQGSIVPVEASPSAGILLKSHWAITTPGAVAKAEKSIEVARKRIFTFANPEFLFVSLIRNTNTSLMHLKQSKSDGHLRYFDRFYTCIFV
jgi:hypothetical protein